MGVLRWLAQAVILLLFLLLVPLSILTLWVRDEVRDTDHYVATIGPLAAEPAIQRQITIVVMGYLDRAAAGLESLSPEARTALQSGYDASRATIEEAIREVVESDGFRTLWEEANRLAHRELAAVLAGEPLPLTTEPDGLVEADLAPVYAELQSRLHDAGLTLLDDVDPAPDQLTIALFPSRNLQELRRDARWLGQAALALPLATAGAAILYVIVSRRRWRAVFWLSLALVLGTLAVWLVVWVGRETAADHLEDDSAREAALAVYDTVARTLRPRTVALALLGAGIALSLSAVRFVRGRRPVAA